MKSKEVRKTAVRMLFVDGVGVASTALAIRMSRRSLTRYYRYFHDTGGGLNYDSDTCNRHRDNLTDNPELRRIVIAAVASEPELFLDEITVAVNHVAVLVEGAVEVSANTVCLVLARNGFTRKVTERSLITQRKAPRVLWVEHQWMITLRFCVC